MVHKRVKGEDPHRATQEVHYSRGNRLKDTVLNSPVVMEVHQGNHNNNSILDNKAADSKAVIPHRANNSNSVNLDAQCSPEAMYHILKRSKDSNVVLCKLSTVDRAHRNKQVDILLAKVVVGQLTDSLEDTRTADQNKVARANNSSSNQVVRANSRSSSNALLRSNNQIPGCVIQIPGRILELWVTCN
jgi:hypothetical protein